MSANCQNQRRHQPCQKRTHAVRRCTKRYKPRRYITMIMFVNMMALRVFTRENGLQLLHSHWLCYDGEGNERHELWYSLSSDMIKLLIVFIVFKIWTLDESVNNYVIHLAWSCELFRWWRHHMETFSALLAICAGNSSVTGEFPAHRPVTRSFDVFLDLRLING